MSLWSDADDAIITQMVAADSAKAVQFSPAGGALETVDVIVSDSFAATNGGLISLFGNMATSGFSRVPERMDAFKIDGVDYRVIEAPKVDQAGGITIALTLK